MRYYLIAGERSGDRHGGDLIQALRQKDPQATFRCWGGACMEKNSGNLVVHYRELAFMGMAFLPSLFKLLRYLRYLKKDLLAYQPDAVLLIDYSGFNMRVARYAKKHHIPTCYYISPKIWAWNSKRVHAIKAYVDKMFTIFPFEKEFYQQYDYAVDFVGNPSVTQVHAHVVNHQFRAQHNLADQPIIALLPGSRVQEVKKILPVMLSLIPAFANFQFIIAATQELPATVYEPARHVKGVVVLYEQTYDILAHAHSAVVTSGTATLETALFQVPQVVVYKTDALTYWTFRWFIQTPFISLVNILAGKKVVTECIQHTCTPHQVGQALASIVKDHTLRYKQRQAYTTIKRLLGQESPADKAAGIMVDYLTRHRP